MEFEVSTAHGIALHCTAQYNNHVPTQYSFSAAVLLVGFLAVCIPYLPQIPARPPGTQASSLVWGATLLSQRPLARARCPRRQPPRSPWKLNQSPLSRTTAIPAKHAQLGVPEEVETPSSAVTPQPARHCNWRGRLGAEVQSETSEKHVRQQRVQMVTSQCSRQLAAKLRQARTSWDQAGTSPA